MKGVMAIVKNNDKFLLGIEAKDSPAKGKWRLLGGKLEAGESAQKALERELAEEAGISVNILKRLGTRQGDYLPIEIAIYLTEYAEGTLKPRLEEIEELRYFSLTEIKDLELDNISRSVFDEYGHLI